MAKFYGFGVELSTTVAAGGQGQFFTKCDSDSDFLVQSLVGTLFTTQVELTTSVKFTPFPFDSTSSPGTTGNSLANLAAFRIQVEVNSQRWFSIPIRANLILNPNGGTPNIFQTQPVLGFGSDIVITLFNDSTFAAQGQLFFVGAKRGQ